MVVRDLLRWFSFERRGAKVNAYILGVLQQEGLTCSPALDAAYPDGELTFASVVPLVVVAPAPRASTRDQPYPIAVFSSIAAAQSDLRNRVVTRLDALERLVAYLVFAELASIRAGAGNTYRAPVTVLLRPLLPTHDAAAAAPLSFGKWVELARKLAPLVPETHDSIHQSALAFAGEVGSRVATIAVPRRNKLAHGSNADEEWFSETESILEHLGDDLREALAPLLDCELVSTSKVRPGERENYLYELRVLHGTDTFFRRRSLETSVKLTPGWAHLVTPDGSFLRLSPGIAAFEDKANEQVRLFLARSLALDAGAWIKLQAILGGEQRNERLPL